MFMSWLTSAVEDKVAEILEPQIKSAMRSSVRDSLHQVSNKWKKQVQSSPLSNSVSFPVTVTYPSDSEGLSGIVEMRVVSPNSPPPAINAPMATAPSPSDFIQSNGNKWSLLMGNQPKGITPLGVSQASLKLNRAAKRKQAKNPGLQRIINSYQPKKKQSVDPMKWMNRAIQNVQDTENMSKYAQSTFIESMSTQINGIQ